MSEISKQALKVDNSTSFPNNTTGYISPTILRAFNVNMIDSLVEQEGYNDDSSSWNVSIGALNTYTSSFAPSLTQLNAFTASQLTINSGINAFTQSTGASITNLNTFSSSFNTYTASINQIRSNGVTLGTSTIFNLVGPGTFFSASLVQNVQGNIATLTFTSDNAKVNTSSFNDYTASTAASQSVFSASVATSFSASNATFAAFSQSQNSFNLSATASLVELLNLSSSLSGGYATQGELDQSASVLQGNINQKLFTSSFNDYTQSFSQSVATDFSASNSRINVLSSFTGSYATTGSNTFVGGQVIDGANLNVLGQYASITLASNLNNSGSQYPGITAFVDPALYSAEGVFAGYTITDTNTNTSIVSVAANAYTSFAPETVGGLFGGGQNQAGSDAAIIIRTGSADMYVFKPTTFQYPVGITGSLGVTNGASISGSLRLTGSVYQNVNAITISAQTASIDLSVANYFTLTLSGSTRLNITNPQPGLTATLVINTSTGASASFNSNVKQPSGSFYAASPSGNIDIISFTAVDTNTIYAFPAQSFV